LSGRGRCARKKWGGGDPSERINSKKKIGGGGGKTSSAEFGVSPGREGPNIPGREKDILKKEKNDTISRIAKRVWTQGKAL